MAAAGGALWAGREETRLMRGLEEGLRVSVNRIWALPGETAGWNFSFVLPERAPCKGQETATERVTTGVQMPEEEPLSDPSEEMHFSLPGCYR